MGRLYEIVRFGRAALDPKLRVLCLPHISCDLISAFYHFAGSSPRILIAGVSVRPGGKSLNVIERAMDIPSV